MFGIDIGIITVLGGWGLLCMLCVYVAAFKLCKYLIKKKNIKKRPNLTLIQGGKKED